MTTLGAITRARLAITMLAITLAATACAGEGSGAGSRADTLTVGATLAPAHTTPAGDSSTVTVYKSPTCGCCTAWVDHMRQNGFRVVTIDTDDVDAIKRQHGVHSQHASCHTGLVGGYVVEGHVPAADVRRLLTERPAVTGLAVPGMPQGSPGMETGVTDAYQVLAFTTDGNATVFAKH